MQEHDDTIEREYILFKSIKELEKTNKKLASLTRKKEDLTATIMEALGHNHDGQRSYEYGVWKLECRTPLSYSLDKKAYEAGGFSIPDEFNPIKTGVSYSIDKKLCDHAMQNAPADIVEELQGLITVKPGKPSVTIKERV